MIIKQISCQYIKYWYLLIIISIGILSLIDCAGKQVPPEIQAYDMRVMAQPTFFTIPTEKAEEAWSRAQQFIATLSSFRIQTSTEYVIQTYMIDSSWPKYGYTVTRVINGNKTKFIVKCYCTNMFSADRAEYNAHALSHYMVSGELIEQRINR